jgi:hypothetical protein
MLMSGPKAIRAVRFLTYEADQLSADAETGGPCRVIEPIRVTTGRYRTTVEAARR